MFAFRQMGEEFLDFVHSHKFWMLLVVEEDETLDPVHVRAFRRRGVALDTDALADAIQQARLSRRLARLGLRRCRTHRV